MRNLETLDEASRENTVRRHTEGGGAEGGEEKAEERKGVLEDVVGWEEVGAALHDVEGDGQGEEGGDFEAQREETLVLEMGEGGEGREEGRDRREEGTLL